MVTATGRDSNDAYYVQATRALAANLRCENVEFPGHHDVSFWMPEEIEDGATPDLLWLLSFFRSADQVWVLGV